MATTKVGPAARQKPSNGEVSANLKKLMATLQATVAEIQRLTLDGGNSVPSGKPSKNAKEEAVDQIQIWEDDPFLEAAAGADPVHAEPIKSAVPQNDQPLLQTHLVGQEFDVGVFDPSTPEFRYWNAESALARGINFWGPLLPAGSVWSTPVHPLRVQLEEGADFNAFYSRDTGLNFFQGVVDQVDPPVTVFSGESPDVVCHELGHAILDALKPELWDTPSSEVGGFHEAFGDISSTLSALQLPSMRQFVLQQTGGKLNKNSRLTQLARQLGWAIRVQDDPTAVDKDCLRNTSNNFFYEDPAGLPPLAPANQLASEVHSFSRIFSGAFLDILAGMFHIGPAGSTADDSARLETIAQDAGKLLIAGVRLATVVPGFFGQVAAGMIQADHTLNGGRYAAALSSSFVQRGILSAASAVSLVRDLRVQGGQIFGVTRAANGVLQFEGDNQGYNKSASDAPSLPIRPITTRFGLTLYVHLPAEPQRFAVAAATLARGFEDSPNPEEDARSFIEDLIQLNRISLEDSPPDAIPFELFSPGEMSPCAKTHRLVKEDGKTVLKRRHFDCGFAGCKHGR